MSLTKLLGTRRRKESTKRMDLMKTTLKVNINNIEVAIGVAVATGTAPMARAEVTVDMVGVEATGTLMVSTTSSTLELIIITINADTTGASAAGAARMATTYFTGTSEVSFIKTTMASRRYWTRPRTSEDFTSTRELVIQPWIDMAGQVRPIQMNQTSVDNDVVSEEDTKALVDITHAADTHMVTM